MRHETPEIVTAWRKGPPRCCHTCEYYNEAGTCVKFEQEPPEAYAATPDVCPSWMREVPF